MELPSIMYERESITTQSIVVGLYNSQRDCGCQGRVTGVAASLQRIQTRLSREGLRCGHNVAREYGGSCAWIGLREIKVHRRILSQCVRPWLAPEEK